MNFNLLLMTILILLIILFIMMINLMFRVKRLEERSLDISARDVAAFTEQMREVLVESERIAEQLDTAIKERESVLEDLGDLVDARIARLKEFSTEDDNDMHSQVFRLLMQGRTNQEIARILNISVAEVELIALLR